MASIKEISALLLFLLLFKDGHCWFGGTEKKILLQEVKAITLYSDKSTKGRRSTVPQLECVGGGSAPCSAFKPRVVQCVNTGFDGVDVQWECKSDMDNNVRFGSIDVSCEGFDYPDDPYITAGSCGLRYNLDYTRDGHNSQHDYGYGNTHHHQEKYYQTHDSYNTKSSTGYASSIADIIVYCAVGLMVWAFYKTCISSGNNLGDTTYSSTNDDYPTGGAGGGGYGWNTGAGGHGFGNNYGGAGYTGDASCGGGSRRRGYNAGGFWTGAATGGLLGYMFGNRGGNRTGGWGGQNYYGGGGSGWGGGRSYSSGGSSFSSGGGGGTRTASGFGGTSRR